MRISKAANIALIVLAGIALCATLLTIGAMKLGVEFPEWTGIGVAKSQIEGRKYTDMPELSAESVSEGEFQTELDGYLADHVPLRDEALLANAAIQRSSIAAASALFGFKCYPTYFESEYMYLVEENAVNFVPDTWDSEYEELTREFAQGVAKAAKENPDKRFVVYVVPGAQSPAASPAYELMSNPALPALSYDVMAEELASVPNAWVLTSEYADTDAFYGDFFRTDHHWGVKGALTAYANLGTVLGWEPFEYGSLQDFGDFRFFGSPARTGLFPLTEEVFDIDYDFSDIDIEIYKSKKDIEVNAQDHSAFYDYSPEYGKKYYFHSTYYNNNVTPQKSAFRGGAGDRRALLLTNSYGAVLSRPLATQYAELYHMDDLHANSKKKHLSDSMDYADFDDVIFVAQPLAFKTTMQQSPKYFD